MNKKMTYPDNLLADVCALTTEPVSVEDFPVEAEARIGYYLDTLRNEGAKMMLVRRYQYGHSLADIGKDFNSTPQNVFNSIKRLLRKMCAPNVMEYLRTGKVYLLYSSLKELRLSTKARHVLEDYDVYTPKQLAHFSIEKLYAHHYMDARTMSEIRVQIQRLNELEPVDESMFIESLNLSTRTYNALRLSGICKIQEVVSLGQVSPEVLSRLDAISKQEIMDACSEHGTPAVIQFTPESELLHERMKHYPIECLGMSTRAINALHRNGVFMVYELLDVCATDLFKMKSIGANTVREIINQLAEHGYTLKTSNPCVAICSETLPEHQNNALRLAGVTTSDSLLSVNAKALQQVPNLGSKSFDEIVTKLSDRGYCLPA